jgi:carboxyl-terminal processing protease
MLKRAVHTPGARSRPRGMLVATFAAGLCCGLVLAGWPTSARADEVDDTYRRLRVFGQVLSYVQQHYVDDIDETDLMYDAIAGMLRDLDPHTVFMRPQEYNKLKEDTAGEFGGLGIEVREGGYLQPEGGTVFAVLIEAVTPEGPAARAGIEPGDKILAVDDTPLGRMDLPSAVKLLRGVPGTRVVLRIARQGWSTPRDVPLVRRHVRVKSVDSELLDGAVGYVRIRSFQERTDHEVGQALHQLKRSVKRSGGAGLRGLVLDLRDNPGGLFDEGVRVADRFLAEGEIVRTEGRNPRNAEVERAHPRGTEEDYPLVVLVNGGTASASEILAGALQDQGRAYVVGTTSYGKGSVQTLFGLDDGSGLKLTVARYYTPSGRSINEMSIEPDLLSRRGRTGDKEAIHPLLGDRQVADAMSVIGRWPAAKAEMEKKAARLMKRTK